MFYANAFVLQKGVSKILSPQAIAEGVSLDFNLHFRAIFSEFMQTCKGTRNSMTLRYAGTIDYSPNSNL